MKLATAGGGRSAGEDLAEVAGALVWTPRFEGLDKKAHAAVVDDFRNRNQGPPLRAASRPSIAEDGRPRDRGGLRPRSEAR